MVRAEEEEKLLHNNNTVPKIAECRITALVAVGIVATAVVLLGTAIHQGLFPSTHLPFLAKDVDVEKWFHRCSGDGEQCNNTECCQMSGMQCYAKNDGWATCKTTCIPGPDLADVNGEHWSCKKLGHRTSGKIPNFTYKVSPWVKEQCSKPGEKCTETKCCVQEGMQCYVKNEGWANCKASCVPGPDLQDVNSDPWDCQALGPRTPGVPVTPPGVADWVNSTCSKPNENCRSTKCCTEPNVQCYEKNKDWSTCLPDCTPGPSKYDVDDKPWSCKKFGPEWTVTTTTTTTTGFPSLFCFSVSRNFGPEPEIMRFQHEKRAGIFGCDQTAVFCSDPLTLGEGPDAVKAIWFNSAVVGTSKDGTAGNSLLFMHVWDAVNRDGRWRNLDWTVKADPDAIIVPTRLRDHLRPHNSENAFMRNCNIIPGHKDYPMMFGAIEALSKGAVTTYFQNKVRCDVELDWTRLGEDLYLQRCLLLLGVYGVPDMSLIGDNLCAGADCRNTNYAAYHPFKSKESWKGCWGEAMGMW